MLYVSGFGVRNLRSLRDTGWIDIRPINILVGRNSAGKSSLARVFPLLKQSAERRKQAPLLWFGRLVDFGSFADAVSSFAEPAEIELKLRFRSPSLFLSRRPYYARSARSQVEQEDHIDATLTLTEGPDGNTVLQRLTLCVFGVDVVAAFDATQDETLSVGGSPVTVPAEGRLFWLHGAVLPQLRIAQVESAATRVSDDEFAAPRRRPRLGEDDVVAVVSQFVHGNTQRDSKLEIADRLPIASLTALLQHCRSVSSAPDTWRSNMANTPPTNYWLGRLQRALVVSKLDLLLAELDEALTAFCTGVSYLEPLRATAQRYYRREEVSVDELDPKGLNTAFFVQGLTQRDRDSLNDWLTATFGFELRVKADKGHATLHIQVKDGMVGDRNMADVGLGYSQLAPVAIQLWAAQQRRQPAAVTIRGRFAALQDKREDVGRLVVVEQPELHLHPGFQTKLADVFVACVSAVPETGSSTASGLGMRLVAETHSPNLVGRLGELVGQGRIDPDHVNVLVFEPDPEVPGASKIRIAQFDKAGVLQNWPIGFFDY